MGNPTSTPGNPTPENIAEAQKLTDFIMHVQKDVILNLSPTLNKEHVSYPQFFLLTHLTTQEYVIMGDIAKKMGHSTAATTGLIDRLEKMKLVERFYSQEDRRKIMVRITHEGTEFVAKMREEIAKKLREMLQDAGEKTN